jgi:hypothetical protein
MEPLMTDRSGMIKLLRIKPLFGFVTSRCYKATVNESETITDAKAVGAKDFAFASTAVERS